jgi:tetratricopeptide (TPR) repeat protein
MVVCQTREVIDNKLTSEIDLRRGEITLCGSPEFGKVEFPIACNETSRDTFNLAMALLHSFEYEEAEKAFVKVIDLDPNCVMGYWGIAMSNFHSLWMQAGIAYLEKGSKILDVAQKLQKSEQEQDYLDAIHVFYKDYQSIDREKRKMLFLEKMEDLYKKYPRDKEAAIFYALALNATADPTDKTYRSQKKGGAILETIFEEQPNHPGIAHYIIHTYDYPELASMALATARRYADIAPSSAHAQHMPSHIFTRLGLWDEAIASNLNSTASALCYGQSMDSLGHWDEELHGMDYLVYAYLQRGENDKAIAQLDYLNSFKKVFPINFKVAYSAAAIPARIALENKDWSRAAQITVPSFAMDWSAFPWQKSIIHFTRALGFSRLGNIGAAEKELGELKALHQEILDKGEKYQAGQVEIQARTAEAWLQFAKGKKEDALRLMREASLLESQTAKHPVTPGEVLPASQLLGDLLLELKQPAKALEAFEGDLMQHPNRLNSLYGAAIAARSMGDDKNAAVHFEHIVKMTQNSSSNRKEIAEARAFTAK